MGYIIITVLLNVLSSIFETSNHDISGSEHQCGNSSDDAWQQHQAITWTNID